jgi:hypothetical protein
MSHRPARITPSPAPSSIRSTRAVELQKPRPTARTRDSGSARRSSPMTASISTVGMSKSHPIRWGRVRRGLRLGRQSQRDIRGSVLSPLRRISAPRRAPAACAGNCQYLSSVLKERAMPKRMRTGLREGHYGRGAMLI